MFAPSYCTRRGERRRRRPVSHTVCFLKWLLFVPLRLTAAAAVAAVVAQLIDYLYTGAKEEKKEGEQTRNKLGKNDRSFLGFAS